MENKQEGIPLIREETVRMSQMSGFGSEISLAKMRNTNPELYEYLEAEHLFAPELTVPFYNLIQLEYELRRRKIPHITQEALREIAGRQPDFKTLELKMAEYQPCLAEVITQYLKMLAQANQDLGLLARSVIYRTYEALERQAISEKPISHQ